MLHGAIALFNEDMAAALCAAVNDWIAKELLDREPRLRASILVPMHNPELAVAEIERLRRRTAASSQVLLLAMGDTPLGRRAYWPIYAAAEKHELADRHPRRQHLSARADRRPAGRRYRVEDYVAQSAAFEIAAAELPRRGRVPEIPDAASWC